MTISTKVEWQSIVNSNFAEVRCAVSLINFAVPYFIEQLRYVICKYAHFNMFQYVGSAIKQNVSLTRKAKLNAIDTIKLRIFYISKCQQPIFIIVSSK